MNTNKKIKKQIAWIVCMTMYACINCMTNKIKTIQYVSEQINQLQ